MSEQDSECDSRGGWALLHFKRRKLNQIIDYQTKLNQIKSLRNQIETFSKGRWTIDNNKLNRFLSFPNRVDKDKTQAFKLVKPLSGSMVD